MCRDRQGNVISTYVNVLRGGGGVQASSPVLWNVAVSKWGLKSESDEGMQRNKGWMLWKEPMYVKVQSEEEECHDGISGGQG